jgi:transposase, IS5 family
MYRRRNNGQISIEEYHLPFGGTLDADNRWVKLEDLMPWTELEKTYEPQFNATIGVPAISVRLAFGALYIKQKLGLTDEETIHQIRENAYMQFFMGFAGYMSKAPHDPSLMMRLRKQFSDEGLRRINEFVVQRGKAMLVEALAYQADDDELGGSNPGRGGDQFVLEELIKPADWPDDKHWGSLTIDASCTPADITHPRDLKLVNEARTTTG